ncbi:hypothetical protein BGX34_009786 [Mortierella sp. NVP85]|nr:hypothetical protein BGX34_009786 [Mortierella sp. NVP85]
MTKASDTPTTIQVVLSIPHATIYHHATDATASPKTLIGTGELRVYSTVQPDADKGKPAQDAPPQTSFMALEDYDSSSDTRKNLIAHPLMPNSTAEKTAARVWKFSVPGSGSLELQLLRASDEEVSALENLLTDRIVYTNQHQFRNKLALVDDVGQVIGILDEEDVEVDDQDNVSLCEDKKSPVIIRAIEPQDDNEDKPLKLKVSVPSADDMADYLTTASQHFGARMVRGATRLAGGITSSSAYINSKIPETQNPLKVSPFIKNRVRNLTQVSRVTFSVTGRIKSTVIQKAFDTGYKALKSWSAKDDPHQYSTMQNFCYSLLNSAGIIIQATEESIGIISTPAIIATQDLAGKFGPEARELVTEALEGLKVLTLVYFDGAGVSRKAFLHTTRMAALQTSQEVKEGKIKLRERKKNPSEHVQGTLPFAATANNAVGQAKELYFKYFGKTDNADTTADTSASNRS